MTGKEYLQRVRKHIYYVFDRDSIEQELAEHLQDSMDSLRDEGHSKEEVFLQSGRLVVRTVLPAG